MAPTEKAPAKGKVEGDSEKKMRTSMTELMTLAEGKKRDLDALYGQPSHISQVNKNYTEQLEVLPGPGHFFGPGSECYNSVGKAPLSKTRSAPNISIAKTNWDSWSNVRISGSHNNSVPGTYKTLSAGDYDFNLSTLSKKGISVSKDRRFKTRTAITASPGPVYDIREQHCKDITTDIPGYAAARFNQADRFLKNPGDLNVAPGQYDRKDSAIRLDFATAASFGAGRKAYHKIVRPGWEEDRVGREGPGVGPPLWSKLIQPDGAHLIPKATRFPKGKTKDVPGPGAYPRHERDVCNLKSRLSDTRNPVGCKFGKPNRKPRLQMDVLARCEDGCWGYF